jgi:hypothetical protein
VPLALNVPFIHHPVKASDVIASLALVVSIIALLRPWWMDWRHNRKASFEVRNEEYQRPVGWKMEMRHSARFVIKNHGPAIARDVRAEFRQDGQPANTAMFPYGRTDTPLLHVGEEYHIEYSLAAGEGEPDSVVVTWRDRRWREQRHEFWSTVRYV